MPTKFGKVDASKRPGCVIMKIPHPGYYDSLYNSELDAQSEQECEHRAQSDKGNERAEDAQPEGLRLTAEQYSEIIFDCVDWRKAEAAMNVDYVAALANLLTECCGFKIKLHYESMVSPREYNFTTDRIFVDVPKRIVRKFFAISRRDKHKALARQIKRRCTSYDGFISSYENELEPWLETPVEQWDHNELETLLLAVLDLKFGSSGDAEAGHDFGWAMYYATTEDDAAFMAFQGAVDWDKFDRECADKRGEMLADMRREAGETFVPPTPRCPDTPDMFNGKH